MADRASSAKPPLTKDEVQSRLAAAWARTIAQNGGKKGAFADALGCHSDTVSNAMSGISVPELHTVLNSLRFCPNALDEVFGAYGFRLVPDDQSLTPDMRMLIEATRFAASLADVLEDRRRTPRETLELADQARPLIQALGALIAEADEIKSGNVRRIA